MSHRHERIVVCASAKPELKPGYETGYHCHACEHPLQVSPFGLPHVKQGGIPFCNVCGFEVIVRERRRLEASPIARLQAERAGRSTLDELRRRRHR